MLKKTFSLLLLAFCCQIAYPQNIDSATFVDAKWSATRIAAKVKLITHHFSTKNLFASNENVSYVEIKSKKHGPVFSIGYEVSKLKPTSSFATASNAIAAVNGIFFDVKNGGSVDFIKAEGKIIPTSPHVKTRGRARHQQAAVMIQDGRLSIVKWDGTPDWELKLPAQSIMTTGPLLILNNEGESLDSSSFTTSRHPRTAIGIKPNGRVIMLTVDGRNTNSAGVNLTELTKIMKWLGCSSAINLDGGGSTTLWVKGFPENGIINYPTDNKLWDHAGERKVANVILLKKKP